jgi:hypothetical protein
MFGVDNTGVINQRQSPAIWQSDISDFPPNYILGRILIDTFAGEIWLDTSNTRVRISNGSNTFLNGLTSYGGSPTNTDIGLGGDLNDNTTINLNDFELNFDGAVINNKIDNFGVITNKNTETDYMPVDEDDNVVIPNTSINIYNLRTGAFYRIAVQKFV